MLVIAVMAVIVQETTVKNDFIIFLFFAFVLTTIMANHIKNHVTSHSHHTPRHTFHTYERFFVYHKQKQF